MKRIEYLYPWIPIVGLVVAIIVFSDRENAETVMYVADIAIPVALHHAIIFTTLLYFLGGI